MRSRTKFSNNFDNFISNLALIKVIKKEPENEPPFSKFRTVTVR
jgi:hypothetical protein